MRDQLWTRLASAFACGACLAACATAPTPSEDSPAEPAIEYGDDSSDFARDGECDDPRFEGEGVYENASIRGVRTDAEDCRAAVEAGAATYVGELPEPFTGIFDDIDFGDNSGTFAFDDECDDPRFEGPAVYASADRRHVRADAADCKTAYEAGTATFKGDLPPAFTGVFDNIDFGDNSGASAFDEECDDPRFEGDGVYEYAHRRNVRADAEDCKSAYDAGTAIFSGELPAPFTGMFDDIDFGDNSSDTAFDDECDDPRFEGPAVYDGANRRYLRADADDCKLAYDAGTASYVGELPPVFSGEYEGIDFGNNSGGFAFDGECDDGRFRGFGMAEPPYGEASRNSDADDCKTLFADGFITFIGDDLDFTGRWRGIDFGDNSGAFAQDGECDDPRFRGPGMSLSPSEESVRQDAFDCRYAYRNGSIILKEAQ